MATIYSINAIIELVAHNIMTIIIKNILVMIIIILPIINLGAFTDV